MSFRYICFLPVLLSVVPQTLWYTCSSHCSVCTKHWHSLNCCWRTFTSCCSLFTNVYTYTLFKAVWHIFVEDKISKQTLKFQEAKKGHCRLTLYLVLLSRLFCLSCLSCSTAWACSLIWACSRLHWSAHLPASSSACFNWPRPDRTASLSRSVSLMPSARKCKTSQDSGDLGYIFFLLEINEMPTEMLNK